jgi:caa(3)-type oxidase subunit IV
MAHESKRKLYIKVFFALIVLTALELWVVQVDLAKGTLITALLGLAVAKAAAVAMYFMHLSDETRWLKLTVGIPLLTLPPMYAFVLIFEAMFRGSLGQ